MNDVFLKKILYGIVIVGFIITAIFYLAWDSTPENNSPNSYQIAQTDSSNYTVPARPNLSGYLFKVILVTVIIMVLIVLGAKWYGKFSTIAGSSSQIKILAKTHIGSKQILLIIRIEGRKLLLGVTDHSINLISDLGESNESEDEQLNTVQEYPNFASFLKQFRKGKNE